MNTFGIWYRVFFPGVFIITIGLIVALLTIYLRRKNVEKPTKKKKIVEVLSLSFIFIVGIGFMLYYLVIAINPTPVEYVGTFQYEQRNSRVAPPLPVTFEYVFSDEENEYNQVFYMDTFSKEKIFSKDLEQGVTYKIYYDKSTNIIMKIEIETGDG